MNIVKIFRVDSSGAMQIKRIKCTQSTKFYARLKRTRHLPYPHEVYKEALNHGWSLTKAGALENSRPKMSKLAHSVRRAVLDPRPGV